MAKRKVLLIGVIAVLVVLFYLAYRVLSETRSPDDGTFYDYVDFEQIALWDALESIDEYFWPWC